jgi:hypothetical protein
MSEPRAVTRETMPRPKTDLTTKLTATTGEEEQDRPYHPLEDLWRRLRTERYRAKCVERGLDPETFAPAKRGDPEKRRIYLAIIAEINALPVREGGFTP